VPRQPEAPTPRSARLLGWFLAVNAVAAVLAVLGAAPGATEAAGRIAWWCGIR
jgi:hypothetical protein